MSLTYSYQVGCPKACSVHTLAPGLQLLYEIFSDISYASIFSEPICAVGYGVAALFSAKNENNKSSWSFKNYSLTGVSSQKTLFDFVAKLQYIS